LGEGEIIDELEKDESERLEVLKYNVKWEAFGNAYYSKNDTSTISGFDKRKLDRTDLLTSDGKNLARIFLVSLSKINSINELKYVVTLVYDVLKMDVPGMFSHFQELAYLDPSELVGIPANPPFGTLFTILRDYQEDAYIVNKITTILMLFLVNFTIIEKEAISYAIGWFVEKLKEPKSTAKNIANYYRMQIRSLENLREIFRSEVYRKEFARQGLKPLFALATYNVEAADIKFFQIQHAYSALYCIWLLTFQKEIRKNMSDPLMVRNICFLLKLVEKDKIIRLCFAILRNLLGVTKIEELMISFGLPKSIEQIKLKTNIINADKDILEDLQAIEKVLEKTVDDLTTFDVYRNEVLSTKLEWTPAHKSQKFWTENCFRMEESDNLLLRTLKDILVAPEADPAIVVIACWDLGEFVRFHPRGRKILDNLDVKTPIMKLLTSKDEAVESAALLTLQKLLLTNWDLYLIGNQ